MVNILNNQHTIDDEWCFSKFKQYILPDYKVVVIAFSFRDSKIRSLSDWDNLYSKIIGTYYFGIVNSFKPFGIEENNIVFVNYFSDSVRTAKEKIHQADILYFLGGLPDRMYDRLIEFDLIDEIKKHSGVVMGFSAGAMIQLSEYHISPDNDYPFFTYAKGIGLIEGFGIEVHIENSEIQRTSIEKFRTEKKKPVYAIGDKGAVIVNGTDIQMVGDVVYFPIV